MDKFVNILKSGGVIAFPTETVYGLGADAWNRSAVEKVFEIKKRPSDNPLIVHIASITSIHDFATDLPPESEILTKAFWPGPLTLIFRKKSEVLDIVTAGLPTVALRWPSHPISQELISLTGPLVAPSANSSGRPSPTRPEHVKDDFGEDFQVIEAGSTQIGLESTVLDISEKPFRILRPGAIGRKEIEQQLGMEIIEGTAGEDKKPKSPGTKYSHYSPDAAVRWLKEGENAVQSNVLYLFHDQNPGAASDFIFYYGGDYKKMAHQLYDRFRQADHLGINEIVVEPFWQKNPEDSGVVTALRNRIEKAIS